MKRYLVFAGSYYYPVGGWGDLQESFDTLEEAKKLADAKHPQMGRHLWSWAHVVDTQTGKQVYDR